MDERQNGLCDLWYARRSRAPRLETPGEYTRSVWQACLDANGIGGEQPAIPEGYFKIGEEVELAYKGKEFIYGRIVVSTKHGYNGDISEYIVRRPVFTPSEGDRVLIRGKTGLTDYAIAASPTEIYDTDQNGNPMRVACEMRPWDASKLGKKW